MKGICAWEPNDRSCLSLGKGGEETGHGKPSGSNDDLECQGFDFVPNVAVCRTTDTAADAVSDRGYRIELVSIAQSDLIGHRQFSPSNAPSSSTFYLLVLPAECEGCVLTRRS
jgi:hypothetical protein